jgi:hypothetical protein
MRYMEHNLDRESLGQAAERALANYRSAGLAMPGDDGIRLVERRIKIRKWMDEPVRQR